MKVAILQPAFIPWRGYFHQMEKVDVFVFYDDVQFERGGWQNRNRVKGPNGPTWLTVPVARKGHLADGVTIREMPILWTPDWAAKHLRTLTQAYAKRAPYFADHLPLLAEAFDRRPATLTELTIPLLERLAGVLGVTGTRFVRSSELAARGTKTSRLLSILTELGADHYLSGPAARTYLEEDRLAEAGIALEYMTYAYDEYPQLHLPYDPAVSVLDLLFMTGPRAGAHIWG